MKKHQINQRFFLILIPLVMFFVSFVFDFLMIFIQDFRLEHTTKTLIKNSLTYNTNDYHKYFKENYEKRKISTDYLIVNYDNDKLTVYNTHSYTSFFGKLLGINSYRSTIHLEGYKSGTKFTFTEVRDE